MTNPLHILQLRVTNYGILKDAHITPIPRTPTVLAGDNGQGKSTTLNAIESILSGSKIARPIRNGETKALIQIVLGDPTTGDAVYTVERKLTAAGGDALVIKDPEGKQVPSPAKFMASLIGSGSAIDPTEIMQARPGEKAETFAKRQAQTLLERLGLAEKMDAIEAQIKTQFDARKIQNSRVDDLTRDVETSQNYPASTPDAPVDVAKASLVITACNGTISAYTKAQEDAEKANQEKTQAMLDVEEAEAALKQKQAAYGVAAKKHLDLAMAVVAQSSLAEAAEADLKVQQAKLSSANEINANVTRKLAHKAAKAKLETATKEAHALTTKIEELRKSKTDLVKTAKLPVDDLEFTDDGLLYKGLPLSQESTGIQTRVCSLMAMAEQPQCRVILLRNATLLNTANRAIIHEIAKEQGYQVWEEVFTETKPEDGLWIVEGEIK